MRKIIKTVFVALLGTISAKAQYTMNSTTSANQIPSNYRSEGIADPFNEALLYPPSALYHSPNYPYTAQPFSHLTLAANGSVYFINSAGTVFGYVWNANLGWQLSQLCPTQWANMAPYAGLTQNEPSHLYGIGIDGKAYNIYQSGSTWLQGALNPSQPVGLAAKPGLVQDAAGIVYGVGTNGILYSFTYTGSTPPFACAQVCTSQFIGLNTTVPVTYEPASGKFYGIGTDGKAYNFYKVGGVWNFNCLDPAQPVPFDPKCPLVVDAAGTIYGIGTNGIVYSMTYTGGSPPFNFIQLCTQSVTVDAAGKLTYETASGKFYVVGTDGKVYNFYKPAGAWAFAPLNPLQSTLTNASGGLTLSDGNIYCIGADGKVDYFYWNSSWQFTALCSQQKVVADPIVGVKVNNRVVYCAGKRPGSTFESFNTNHLDALYYKAQTLNYSEWGTPVLNEEFKTYTGNTDASFLSNWTGCLLWGHTTDPRYEYEYMTPNALSFITDPSDGTDKCLRITANNSPVMGNCFDNEGPNDIQLDGGPNYRQFKYTSGAIYGTANYLYGLFEARVKCPAGTGFWPAFWTYGHNSWPPEMDIFEAHGSLPYENTNNVIWRDPNGNVDNSYMEYLMPTDLTTAYHTYTMMWTPDFITFYIDGQEIRTVDHHVPREPMHIYVTMAVGLQDPSTTIFPAYMDVDYIRVYQKATYAGPKNMEIESATAPDEKTDDLLIFPNPGKDVFTISMNNSEASVVEVYDLLGNLVTKTQMLNEYKLDLSDQKKGVYIVKITTGDKQINKKIILE